MNSDVDSDVTQMDSDVNSDGLRWAQMWTQVWTQMWNCFNWMSLLRLENHSGEIRFCFKYHLMLIKFYPSNSHTYEKKVFWFDLINYSLLLFRFDHFYPFSRIKIENCHLYWITGENYHFDWIKSQSCHWQPFLLPPSNKFSFTSSYFCSKHHPAFFHCFSEP